MNEGLTEENYEALSKYRQERAHETLSEILYPKAQRFIEEVDALLAKSE